MAITANNTTLTFNDATTQTTSGVTSIGTGTGISSTGGKTPTLTNTGVTSVAAGTGISVSASTGGVTISASGGGVTSLNGQTGAITNTSQYAIGSYLCGRPANDTIYNRDTTLAGSSLYNIGPGCFWEGGSFAFPGYGPNISIGVALVNTGTWRAVSQAGNGQPSFAGYGFPALWVRVS